MMRRPEGLINGKSGALLACLVLLLSTLYSALSVVRHNHFQSGGFDLGIFDQAVWQYSKFLYPYNTVKERFILGDHLTINLPLLAPLFWIWNDVRMLLVAQATWISFSAIAIYKLVTNRKFSPTVALCLSFLYSTFYGIQFAVFFDFHPVVFGVGLLAWLVYFFETGKQKLFILTLLLVLTTQENMGLALAGFGFIYLFRKETRRSALLFIFVGTAISLFSAKIIAIFSPVGFQYSPNIPIYPLEIIWQFFDKPEKREVIWYTFSWFSFLPVFSPGSLLAVFWDLAQYFVTGPKFHAMWSPFMHHRAILAVYLIPGVLDVFQQLRKRKIPVATVAVAMVVVALIMQYFLHLPLNKLAKREYWKEEAWMDDDRKLISSVDPNASIATQQNFVPHLSHRREIYLVWPRQREFPPDGGLSPCGQPRCWWLDFSGKPEFLVVDTRPDQWVTQTLESSENYLSAIGNMEKAGRISLQSSVGAGKIFRINKQE